MYVSHIIQTMVSLRTELLLYLLLAQYFLFSHCEQFRSACYYTNHYLVALILATLWLKNRWPAEERKCGLSEGEDTFSQEHGLMWDLTSHIFRGWSYCQCRSIEWRGCYISKNMKPILWNKVTISTTFLEVFLSFLIKVNSVVKTESNREVR